MNANSFKRIFTFLLMGIFSFLSCRKVDFFQIKQNIITITKEEVVAWLNKEMSLTNDSEKVVIDKIKESILWDKVFAASNVRGERRYVFQITNIFSENGASTSNVNTALLISVNKRNEITTGNVLSLNVINEISETEKLRLFIKLLDDKPPIHFSGILTKSTISNNFIFELEFKDGKLFSKKNFQKKIRRSNLGGRTQELRCYDVYLVTTYQYPDGSFGQEWEYLYTYCVDEPDCQRIQVIGGRSYRTACGGGDNGGGSGGNSGGGGSNSDTTINRICLEVDSLESNNAFKQRMTALYNSTSLNFEVGYFLQRNSNGSYNYGLIQGTSNTPGLPDFNLTLPQDGLIHTHYSGLLSIFSPDDLRSLYLMYRDNCTNPGFIYGLVTGSTSYLLKIDNLGAFLQFGQQHFEDQASFNIFQNLYANVFGISASNAIAVNEQKFLWLLQENNSGLKLFSGDVNSFNNWELKGLNLNNEVILLNCN
jgi:hypothetical protein